MQLQWGMRSRSVTRPHYKRQEAALITERKWPKQWTKPCINRIRRNYFIHYLFSDKTNKCSNTEEREKSKQRGGEEWFSIPLTTKTLYNWCSFILNTGFNIWEERIIVRLCLDFSWWVMRHKTKTCLGLFFESIISAVQQKNVVNENTCWRHSFENMKKGQW